MASSRAFPHLHPSREVEVPLTYFYIVTLLLGIVAVVHWRRSGQSISRGLGFTFHRWSVGDLLVGLIITSIGMLGIFLAELAAGGIQVIGTRFDPESLLSSTGLIGFGAVFEELLFRS
jgi:membrane protease YdiL (CAAX protease family)